MKVFILLFSLFSIPSWGQLVQSIQLKETLKVSSEESAKKQLLYLATYKIIEKIAPEMGYKFEDFNQKLNVSFNEYFKSLLEKKLVEKFGQDYKEKLSEAEKTAFLSPIIAEEHDLFIKYSHILDTVLTHSFSGVAQDKIDPHIWSALVQLDIDKSKLEKLLRKIINEEKKSFSNLLLLPEIDTYLFSWSDLGLENSKSFLNPLGQSWLKWMADNTPSSVDVVRVCDERCLSQLAKWFEASANSSPLPDEYANSVFYKLNLHLKRMSFSEDLKETTFEWEGWAILQDLNTKRVLASFALPPEKRTFRMLDQKSLNSALASSIYRSPLTAFLQFNRKLEEKIGYNRVSKLVISGQSHLGDVSALAELLKTRGSSLGLEIFIDSFTKDQANLVCFFRGEEKSFTDLLSGIKELKSSHSYTVVSEFNGTHYVLKLITE